ncbi:MAG: ATP-binding cassette domain-containing protein [Planctomycetes bacterium]|nr:ATP-binding cassette domain-containing protein [Planctomycetota bacterium]
MALLTLSGVTKTYDPKRPLLTEVSLVVGEQDRIGLIGANGSGKSTLLKLMAEVEAPDEGTRVQRRDLQVGYLEQEPSFPERSSIREIVRAGLEGREALLAELDRLYQELAHPELAPDRLETLSHRQEHLQHCLDALGGHDVEFRVAAAIDGVGLPDGDALCGSLSGGEARRVALARLLVSGPDLLLLDEPTNHLDAFVVAWLEQQLAALKVPLVLVTHDRFLLDRVVTRILEVDRGRVYGYEGGYGRYLEQRAARLESEAKGERSRLNLLRRETAWMRSGPPARSTKAKARIQRYHELADSAPALDPNDLELAFPRGPRLGAKVVELRGVSHAYGERVVLPKLDLRLEQGMRLGVVGPNGAGKTTLLRILLQRLAPTAGEVVVGETVKVATIDQRREDLDPANTVLQEVAGKNDHVVIGGRAIHIIGFLDRFLFPGNQKEVAVGSLSGGERGRVLLAKLMLTGANVLVLDEPTNDLDLGTLRALEEALIAFEGAVVVVSHDRWFLDRVATHVLHLDGQGGAFLHTGDLSSLMERAATQREAPPPAEAPPKKKAAPADRPPGRLSFKERQELERVVERIGAGEEALRDLDATLADPATYQSGHQRIGELQAERDELQKALEADLRRWEELAGREA